MRSQKAQYVARYLGAVVGALLMASCHNRTYRPVQIHWQSLSQSLPMGEAPRARIDFLAPRGGMAYGMTVAARLDTRVDSLVLPIEICISTSSTLYSIDTISLHLASRSVPRDASRVSIWEVQQALPKPFAPPLAGIYSFELRPLVARSAQVGLVALGLEFTQRIPLESTE